MANPKFEKEGLGVLFIHDKKSEKAPDYKGDLILDRDYSKGEKVKIAGWRKDTPRNHLISLRIDDYKASSESYPKPANRRDDEIPF